MIENVKQICGLKILDQVCNAIFMRNVQKKNLNLKLNLKIQINVNTSCKYNTSIKLMQLRS